MRFYLILSLLFHLVVGFICFFGLPSFLEKQIKTDYVMVTEVVTVADLTNVMVKSAKAPEKQVEVKKAPKPIKEEVTEAKKAHDNKAEIIEKDNQPSAENIKPKKKEEKPKQDKKKAENKDKKEEVKKKPKKKDDSFEKSILASLEEAKKKPKKELKKEPEKKDKKIDKDFLDLANALVGETNKEFDKSLPFSVSEIDAIRNQISRNWNTTSFSGASEAKGMRVKIRIELDVEGDVLYVKPLTENNNSSHYKVFVESAVRAVKLSSPIQSLNKEKFSSWKEIEFDFDSSGMIY